MLHCKLIDSEDIKWPVVLNKIFNFFRIVDFLMLLKGNLAKTNLFMQKFLLSAEGIFSSGKPELFFSWLKAVSKNAV